MSALSDSLRMLEITLPSEGCVVAFAEVYMDESYQDDGPVFCVAGYVFRRRNAREFSKSWGNYLNKRKGLPYFHMNELAGPSGVFKGRKDCDEIARRLIKETRTWSAYGFAVIVDRDLFKEKLSGVYGMADDAYGFALMAAMIMVRNWCGRAKFAGDISYFFEEGHHSRADAERFLAYIYDSPVNRARYQYRTHAFLPKETPWLHPADFLAWHWRREEVQRRLPVRRPVRKDLQAMVRPHLDMTMTYDAEHIAGLRAEMDKLAAIRAREALQP